MKKALSLTLALVLAASLLAACGGGSDNADSTPDASTGDTGDTGDADDTGDTGDAGTPDAGTADSTVDVTAAANAIMAVNPVDNPLTIDDMYVEYDLGLTADNILAYGGAVTNNGDDCALVFVAQTAPGTADAVMEQLNAHKEAASSNLYAEFADKVAKAKDAIITAKGDVVVYVIAGVNGPDYADIQAAIDSALPQ